MTEEAKGTNEAGDADQQTTGKAAAAGGQQGGSQDAAGSQEAKKEAGFQAAYEAEKQKRQQLEADMDGLKDQMRVVTANKPQVEQKPLFNQMAERMGYDPEYMTTAEMARVNEAMLDLKMGQLQQQFNHQTFLAQHPDFEEIVGVAVSETEFKFAPPLKRILDKNPVLKQALSQSPNAAVLAYEIASKDPQYLKEKADKAKTDEQINAEKAQAALDAANKQASISAAKGGGQLDSGAAIAAMTDEELRAHNEKIIQQAM